MEPVCWLHVMTGAVHLWTLLHSNGSRTKEKTQWCQVEDGRRVVIWSMAVEKPWCSLRFTQLNVIHLNIYTQGPNMRKCFLLCMQSITKCSPFFFSNIAQRKSEGPVVERRLYLSVYVADGEALLPQRTCSDMVSRMTEVAPATSLCHHRLTSTAENPTLTYTQPVHRSTHTHLSFITSSIYPHHLSWSLGVLKASWTSYWLNVTSEVAVGWGEYIFYKLTTKKKKEHQMHAENVW